MFFFICTRTPEIHTYLPTLSLRVALPIWRRHLPCKASRPVHRHHLPAATEVAPAFAAVVAGAAGNQRVDHHPASGARSGQDGADRLVDENERRLAALVPAAEGVHVGTADAAGLDPQQRFAGLRRRVFNLALVARTGSGVAQGLNFAVQPPST